MHAAAAVGMSLWVAAGWGFAGGIAAGLVTLSSAILKAGYTWPWRNNPDGVWPRLATTAAGVAVGAIAAAAAHGQMNGPWPALLLGVGATAVIRGAIASIEVDKIEQTEPQPSVLVPPQEASANRDERGRTEAEPAGVTPSERRNPQPNAIPSGKHKKIPAAEGKL